MKILTAKLLLINFLFLVGNSLAATFYVNVSNTVPVSPFSTWPTAATNIQNAIDVSSDGDLVLVSNGVYKTGGQIVYGASSNRVVINKAITVQSVNGPAKTFIQGSPSIGTTSIRCVYLTNNAMLIGFTLTNGATCTTGNIFQEESGGGLWAESTSATVSNCIIANNRANYFGGGAVLATLINCTLTNNSCFSHSGAGGGAFLSTLTNCYLFMNSAYNGGGAGSNVVNNCTLLNNWASASGGGAFYSTLSNSFLFNNSATNGGGAAYGVLTSCTLTNNRAYNGGGSFSNVLFSCMLTNNYATNNGGGVFSCTSSNCALFGNSVGGSSFNLGGGAFAGVLNNCIISSNSAIHGGGTASNILNGCRLVFNNATDGGGAFGSVLNSCTVNSNTAGLSGGGSYGGALNACIIKGNQAAYGGGDCSDNLNDCLILNNKAVSPGFLCSGAYSCNLTNCTVTQNFSSTVGAVTSPIIVNCIVYNNIGGNSTGGNFLNCCTTPLPVNGNGNFTNAPVFFDQVNGDYHLQSNCVCINAGKNVYVISSSDLDGNSRIIGGTVDMGAYEYQTPSSVLSYYFAQQYGFLADGSADYADPDGDGMNNYQEWIAGTNPTNNLSLLEMYSPVYTNTLTEITLSWQSVTNVTYYLQRSSDLTVQPSFSSIQSNIVGQVGTTSFTDLTATNSNSFFYRVGVQ